MVNYFPSRFLLLTNAVGKGAARSVVVVSTDSTKNYKHPLVD